MDKKFLSYLYKEHNTSAATGAYPVFRAIVDSFVVLENADVLDIERYVHVRKNADWRLRQKLCSSYRSGRYFDWPHRVERMRLDNDIKATLRWGQWKPDMAQVGRAMRHFGFRNLLRKCGSTTWGENYLANYLKFDGTWRVPVWNNEHWFYDSPYYYAHQCHQSEKDPTMVAYNQNLDKLARNIQTAIKPGRYLQQFFGDVLSQDQIKYWAERQGTTAESRYTLHVLNNNEWQGDKVGLQKVWKEMYSRCLVDYSCMRGFSAPRVYGLPGNHLGLAVWTRKGDPNPFENEDTPVYGRAIVRFDEIGFNRVFPFANHDAEMHESALQTWLKSAGFPHTGTLEDIYIDYQESDSSVVCPYIDGDAQYVEVDYAFGQDVLRIGHSGHEACNTSGKISLGTTCAECGGRFDDDDLYYIDSEDIHICSSCFGEEFVEANNGRGVRTIRRGDAIYCESDGEYYTENGADYHGVIAVDYGPSRGDYYHNDDLVDTSRGTMLREEAVELDECDPEGNDWACEDDTIETEDGKTIHCDHAITTLSSYVYHEDNVDLMIWTEGHSILHEHVDDIDPACLIVIGDALFHYGYPERGAMTLLEWLQAGGGELANVNQYPDTDIDFDAHEEPLRLAA